MSFFDEADEPVTERRTEPRRSPRSRRPSGSGRRPPGDQQAIQVRRAVAAVVVVVVLILIVLGVHSCQVSQRNSALKDYTNNVSSLNQQSTQTGAQLFTTLSAGGGSSNATNLQQQINQTLLGASSQLKKAKALSVPSEMSGAQQHFVLAMQMRSDGVADIANQIQPALGKSTNRDALNSIATDMARFYGSDVIYKAYTTPLIVGALHGAGIAVGTPTGETIDGSQFLPDIQWLTPSYIASRLGASLPASSGGKVAPGLHGHSLNSVSVGGTTLQSGATNTLTASPPPTFSLSITNGGQNNETNVTCKVTVSGTNVSGQTVVPQTTAGQTTNCNVTLNSSPSAGTYTVTAEVVPVPGEKNTGNNSLSFPVTFQ